jgi:hypothetical protein
MLGANGERWVQLMGNHEAQYVHDKAFAWHEELDDASQTTLRRWWSDGNMRLAFSCDTEGVAVRRAGGKLETIGAGGLLVTHAGLTDGCWEALGSAQDATTAAAVINDGALSLQSPVWNYGRMLERYIRRDAGVLWAVAGDELLAGWLDAERAGVTMPFHQAHGHSTAYWWDRGAWVPPALGKTFAGRSHVSASSRIIRVEVAGSVVWGVDPAHSVNPASRWEPLVLQS